jgi:hypothetical protein
MKKLTLTIKNISLKQWSNLLLELNIIKKAWKPFAELEIKTPNLKKIIAQGTRIDFNSDD